jgi:hypothetical protein
MSSTAGLTNEAPLEGQLIRREADESLDIQAFRDRIAFEGARIDAMKGFIQSQMVVGTHYGKIPGTNGKPTLLKPGAELLTNIHGMNPRFEETERVYDRTATKHWEKYEKKGDCRGYIKYSYRCTLHRTRPDGIGIQVGEGVGTCNNWEKKYLTVDADDAENTIMKMAKKRAFIDAVLTATRTSDFFTQDMEDMPEASDADEDAAPRQPKPAPQNQEEGPGETISEGQHSRMWALAFARAKKEGMDSEWAKSKLNNLVRDFGFGTTKQVTKGKYKAICDDLEAPF